MTIGIWIFIVLLFVTAAFELIFPNEYITFWKKVTYSRYLRAFSIFLLLFSYLFYMALEAARLKPLIWILIALIAITGLWILIHPTSIVRLGESCFFDRIESQKYFIVSADFFIRIIVAALLLYAVL